MGGTKELFTGEERMRQKPRKRIKKGNTKRYCHHLGQRR
jgi:hypothetical protein